MSNIKLFAVSLTCTTCLVLCVLYANRTSSRNRPHPVLTPVGDGVYLSSQLTPDDMAYLRQYVRAIVDIRPDGEARDQPSHFQMETAAKAAALDFYYIPVPHENIPAEAVNVLSEVFSHRHTPIVLYCRTGRRAVRTFALSEASRADGPAAQAILAMVRDAGFSADDLKENIVTRIAGRHPASEGMK